MRKRRQKALLLTYKEDKNVHDIKKDIKNLLSSLRGKSNNRAWDFIIMKLVISDTNPRTKQKVKPHVHIICEAQPGVSVINYINKYWQKRHGIIKIRDIYDVLKFERYLNDQISIKLGFKYRKETCGR